MRCIFATERPQTCAARHVSGEGDHTFLCSLETLGHALSCGIASYLMGTQTSERREGPGTAVDLFNGEVAGLSLEVVIRMKAMPRRELLSVWPRLQDASGSALDGIDVSTHVFAVAGSVLVRA
jgi:hypothetical protein